MDDIFSTNKGAGIIGMVLALIVFAAFIGLGVAVFDGRFNGDNARSIESVLKQQEAELESLEDRTKVLNRDIEEQREHRKLRTETEAITGKLERLADAREGLEAEIADVEAGMAAMREAKNTYRQSYRDAVRARAVGTVIDELKTLDGRVFKSVRVRKVTPLELSFMTETGPKTVPYEDLPEEMQDYYQFGDDEAKATRQARAEADRRTRERMSAADDQKLEKKEAARERREAEERLKAEQQIAILQRKINDAEARIQQENLKAAEARRLHAEARARGNSSAHMVTVKRAEDAAESWRKAIEEARNLIEIERKKLQ